MNTTEHRQRARIDRAVGKLIRGQRTCRATNQQALATAIGIKSHTAISRIETGEQPVTIAELSQMLPVLGITWTELGPKLEEAVAKCSR